MLVYKSGISLLPKFTLYHAIVNFTNKHDIGQRLNHYLFFFKRPTRRFIVFFFLVKKIIIIIMLRTYIRLLVASLFCYLSDHICYYFILLTNLLLLNFKYLFTNQTINEKDIQFKHSSYAFHCLYSKFKKYIYNQKKKKTL